MSGPYQGRECTQKHTERLSFQSVPSLPCRTPCLAAAQPESSRVPCEKRLVLFTGSFLKRGTKLVMCWVFVFLLLCSFLLILENYLSSQKREVIDALRSPNPSPTHMTKRVTDTEFCGTSNKEVRKPSYWVYTLCA